MEWGAGSGDRTWAMRTDDLSLILVEFDSTDEEGELCASGNG